MNAYPYNTAMRTAHLIVSGAAFAVWTAACVVYFVGCDNSVTDYWWLYGPAAALPSFWCVFAWLAIRRAGPLTLKWLVAMALPALASGLFILLVAVGDATSKPPPGVARPIGMGTGMVGPMCWLLSVPGGLGSLVWGLLLQIPGVRQAQEP